MKVLVIGSGGREHALAWAANNSALVDKVFAAPGNAGTDSVATNLAIGETEVDKLVAASIEHAIDLVIIGPESSLVAGVADRIRKVGIAVLGPDRKAARIEGSKIYAKEFMDRYGIPTARWEQFDNPRDALQNLDSWPTTPVIKADGLAAGKGVFLPQTKAEATTAIGQMMVDKRFGEAGRQILFEENLQGEEVSYLVLTDGTDFVAFPPSQDHKRIFEGDLGPNTGGMGAYAPTTLADAKLRTKIEEQVIVPFLKGMKAENHDYRGIIYAGIMVVGGEPKVLEFNARFGDPECQPLLFGLDGDFAELAMAAATGTLGHHALKWHSGACCSVVMAAAGYPDTPVKGDAISLPENVQEHTMIFLAGTSRAPATDGVLGTLVTSGGRVLSVTSRGATMQEAQERAYETVQRIKFHGLQYRKDIGYRELARG